MSDDHFKRAASKDKHVHVLQVLESYGTVWRAEIERVWRTVLWDTTWSAPPSSKTEAHPNRGIDVAVLQEAEAQPAMHLVEHHAEIEIPLWCKSPIHCGRNRIIRPGALRMRAVGAEEEPSSGGAEPGILDVMVIGADHIKVIRDGVFRAGPHDL